MLRHELRARSGVGQTLCRWTALRVPRLGSLLENRDWRRAPPGSNACIAITSAEDEEKQGSAYPNKKARKGCLHPYHALASHDANSNVYRRHRFLLPKHRITFVCMRLGISLSLRLHRRPGASVVAQLAQHMTLRSSACSLQ